MIDFNKPVETRDGEPVRILCTDKKTGRSVVGIRTSGAGTEMVGEWFEDGTYVGTSCESRLDLRNIPERKSVFRAIYREFTLSGYYYSTLENCKRYSRNYVAILRIDFEDGVPVSSEIIKDQSK